MGGRAAWKRRKRLLLITVAALASALGVLAYATGTLYSLESQTVNTRFAVRGRDRSLVRNFVIVQIDQATLNYFNNQRPRVPSNWPYPRRYHAQVIDNLARAGAKVIAFDVAFDHPTDTLDDDAVITAVARAHDVVLATTAALPNGATDVFGGNLPPGTSVGDSTVRSDSAGVIRDAQYSFEYDFPTFGVAIAQKYSGRSVSPSLFGGPAQPAPIDYAGPPGTVRAIPYYEVYDGHFDAAEVRGRIVIVGAEASILQDIHETPTSGNTVMDGPEVQANAAASVLAGLPLRDDAGWINVALVVLFGAAVPLATLRIQVLRSLLGALALAAVYTVVVQIAFDTGTIVAYTYPLAALILATLGTLAVVYLGEAFERQRVHQIFARFVPADVVDQVLARTDENLRLGGEERDCTLLFSDLRGFTSFSEHQAPAKVIDAVNFYLNEMTEAILEAGGTLIAYMGDGIMAAFGAPLDQPDHADRALTAAREMMGRRLQRFNAWLHEQGHESGFRMGIGLNSGPVMCGNVGSEKRVEYTTLGDTTNTASRLEGMTKGTPYMLFVAGSTRERMREPPSDMVFVEEFDVRGRKAKLPVWALPDPPGTAM
ncbi:MAG: adenylate/guanylate cyclase domain-containing protein [Solirubrobacteraceae bacterium]|jgi:adenylate cyclase